MLHSPLSLLTQATDNELREGTAENPHRTETVHRRAHTRDVQGACWDHMRGLLTGKQ